MANAPRSRAAASALWAKIARFEKSSFVRSTSVLVGGTAFGQAIMVLALPVLTRLYTPADFSMLAVYVSMLSMVSVAACLRLDIAIPMPEHDVDAANLLALALTSALSASSLAALVVWLVPEAIITLIRQPEFEPYLWLLPLGILLASSYSALQFWFTRGKAFAPIAKTRITQALGGVGAQIAFGSAGVAPLGLLVGQMLNSGAGVLGLGARAIRRDRAALASINPRDMCRLLLEYDRFPKYSTFEALVNNAGIQLPVIIIAALAVGPEAGFLVLAMRVMQAPMGLIGGAVAQVYLSQASDEYRSGNLGSFTASIIGGLMKAGVGPLVFAAIIAPDAFALIFGEEWRRAGEMVRWMTPWFILQFVTSPVSMVLHVTNSQRTALFLQVIGLVVRVGSVLAVAAIASEYIVEVYALSGFVFYLIYLLVVSGLSSIKGRDLMRQVTASSLIVSGWILLALAASYFLAIAA